MTVTTLLVTRWGATVEFISFHYIHSFFGFDGETGCCGAGPRENPALGAIRSIAITCSGPYIRWSRFFIAMAASTGIIWPAYITD
jgi:hypothetical protein